MKSNPILEEFCRLKDELAQEANCDIHQLCENTRRWAAEHPHNGPAVRNAEEPRQLEVRRERERDREAALREEPPRPS